LTINWSFQRSFFTQHNLNGWISCILIYKPICLEKGELNKPWILLLLWEVLQIISIIGIGPRWHCIFVCKHHSSLNTTQDNHKWEMCKAMTIHFASVPQWRVHQRYRRHGRTRFLWASSWPCSILVFPWR